MSDSHHSSTNSSTILSVKGSGGNIKKCSIIELLVFFFILTSLFIGVFFYFTDVNMDSNFYAMIILLVLVVLASLGGFFDIALGADYTGVAWMGKYGLAIMIFFLSAAMFVRQIRRGTE